MATGHFTELFQGTFCRRVQFCPDGARCVRRRGRRGFRAGRRAARRALAFVGDPAAEQLDLLLLFRTVRIHEVIAHPRRQRDVERHHQPVRRHAFVRERPVADRDAVAVDRRVRREIQRFEAQAARRVDVRRARMVEPPLPVPMIAGRMQQRVTGQVVETRERLPRRQARGADRREPFVEQRDRMHVGAGAGRVDHRGVERLHAEVDLMIPGGGDLHLQFGMLGLEPHDARQHPLHHAGRHFQCEFGPPARQAHRHLLDAREAFAHGRQQEFAFGRQRQPLGVRLNSAN